MVKTRSQQKIPFPIRKAKSVGKLEVKNDSWSPSCSSVKACCIATLSRVCREKNRDADSSVQGLPVRSSPAKKKKGNDGMPKGISHGNDSSVEKENITVAPGRRRTRRFLSYQDQESEQDPSWAVTLKGSTNGQQNKTEKEVFETSHRQKSVRVSSAQVHSPKNLNSIRVDSVKHDGSPIKCSPRQGPNGKKLYSSKSSSHIITQSEKKRHSSGYDREKKTVPNRLSQKRPEKEKRRFSTPLATYHREKMCLSNSAPGNVTFACAVQHSSTESQDGMLPGRLPHRKQQNDQRRFSVPVLPYYKENSTPNRQLLCVGTQDGQLYKEAKHVLHSSIPGNLFCREAEIKQINMFLSVHLVHKKPGSLYISGAPGTGKTACLTHVLEHLQKNGVECHIQFINCMNMSKSHRIYSKIAEELTGWDKLTNKEAQKFLEKKFTTKGSPVVLVLDEIDQLESKNQDVLYTMFEWPSLPSSRLILIGVANALDLTDRVLPRLQLRPECKPRLLHFSPYSKDQIAKILTARLNEVEGSSVIDVSAIQFCARKIAAVSGDMRKALDICRRAVEVVESEVKRQQILKPIDLSPSKSPKKASLRKVTIAHVSRVISEVYGSRIINSGGGEQPTIPLQQKILICTVLLMQKESKLREIPVGQLHETYCSICKKRQVSQISQEDCLALCNLLETRGILAMKRAKETRMAKVSLKIDEREVDHALQDKILLSSILQGGLSGN